MTTATFVKYQLANIYHVKSKKELTDEQRKELEEKVAKFKESLNAPKTEEPKETAQTDSKTEETASDSTEETEEPTQRHSFINYEQVANDEIAKRIKKLFFALRKLDETTVVNVDFKKAKITVKRNNRLVARINVRVKSYYLRAYHDSIKTVTKDASLEQIKKAITTK